MHDGWRGKLILNAASFKLARPSGDHISDPLAFASIGERDEESLRRSKNVHWRSVYLARLSTYVRKNPETGQSSGESTRDPVRNR